MSKKIMQMLAIAVLLMIAIPTIKAQEVTPQERVKKPKKTPEQKATQLTDTLSRIVSLTTDQYTKAYAANLKFLNLKEEVKKNNNGDIQAAKEKVELASQERRSEIEAVLTPDQVAKWEAWRKAKKALKDQSDNSSAPSNDADGM